MIWPIMVTRSLILGDFRESLDKVYRASSARPSSFANCCSTSSSSSVKRPGGLVSSVDFSPTQIICSPASAYRLIKNIKYDRNVVPAEAPEVPVCDAKAENVFDIELLENAVMQFSWEAREDRAICLDLSGFRDDSAGQLLLLLVLLPHHHLLLVHLE